MIEKYTVLHRYADGTVLECGNERTDKMQAEKIRQETAKAIFAEIDKVIDFTTENTPTHLPFNYIDMRFIEYYNEIKDEYTGGET